MKIHSTFLLLDLALMKATLSLLLSLLTLVYIQVKALTLLSCFLYPLMDCVINTRSLFCPRLDLSEKPLPQVDLTLQVSGSYLWKEDEAFQAAQAITDQHKPLEYRGLPNISSAHIAELIALTWACLRAEGMKVNIYADNHYNLG